MKMGRVERKRKMTKRRKKRSEERFSTSVSVFPCFHVPTENSLPSVIS
jgi:hypothetical protein